jgi:hypothetical protein
VDERLFFVHGRLPARLRTSDLPGVALAIVAQVRGKAKAAQYFRHGVGFVRLVGLGVDVTVLNEDWKLIVPFLQDGTFKPTAVSSAMVSDASVADFQDPVFYALVLRTLQGIFTTAFPLSNL